MDELKSSFKINGRFSEEEISRYFVDPDMLVQDMILGSTDPAFRKACMLAIIDNNFRSDAPKRVLSHPDFRAELEVLLLENREAIRVSTEEMSEGFLRVEEHLQKLRSDPSPNAKSIELVESLRDQLIEVEQMENKFRQIRNNS